MSDRVHVDHKFIRSFVQQHGHAPWIACGDPEYVCLLDPEVHVVSTDCEVCGPCHDCPHCDGSELCDEYICPVHPVARPARSLAEWIREWADHPDVREWPVDTEGWPQYDDSRSDKRLTPEWGVHFWVERKSERRWHYCKYCYRDTPSFVFREGRYGSGDAILVLRCCWECGSGIELLKERQ